jgi:hypothetical protein
MPAEFPQCQGKPPPPLGVGKAPRARVGEEEEKWGKFKSFQTSGMYPVALGQNRRKNKGIKLVSRIEYFHSAPHGFFVGPGPGFCVVLEGGGAEPCGFFEI